MNLHDLFRALEQTSFATAIREGSLLFPWIESVHVLAIVTVVGSISIIDMRLLGVPAHKLGVRRLVREILPITWIAFAIAATTGFLLFSSAAVKYAGIWTFEVKMLVIALAGLNMLFFHFVTFRSVHLWDELMDTPFAAKVAGGSSLLLWVSVVVLGRWTGFLL
jgi:hypothetical protein